MGDWGLDLSHALRTFDEVFEICMILTETLSDLKVHGEAVAQLELEFIHQQTILAIFARQFDDKLFYNLEDPRVRIAQLKRIIGELRKVVRDYEHLADFCREDYGEMMEYMKIWWKEGHAESEKKVDSLVLQERLEAAGIQYPGSLRHAFVSYDWSRFQPEKVEEVLEDLKNSTKKLVELMKLTLLLHYSDNIDQLREISKDAKTLGFSNLTNTRLFILDPWLGNPGAKFWTEAQARFFASATVRPTHWQPAEPRLLNAEFVGEEVLIECKPYRRHDLPGLIEITEDRIRFTSKLLDLCVADDREGDNIDLTALHLHGFGYFHEPDKRQFGLLFDVPDGYESEPLPLHTAITKFTKDTQPTLGQRFGMAYRAGYALMEWFLIDWEHKAVNSQNIFFFRKAGESDWDFSSPFLGGCDYDRPTGEILNLHLDHQDFTTNIYRHPERQGLPSDEAKFEKTHDIYAFGVVLLEIGMWSVVQELFGDGYHSRDAIRDTLIHTARAKLGPLMGRRYRDVVLLCLEDKLEVGDDDKKQTRLINVFKEKVLDICEEGQRLL